jgi:23S rRNA (guanosine2251-2'-O)-methyltransferase
MKKNHYEQIYGSHAVRQVLEDDISRIIEIWVQQGKSDVKLQTLLQQVEQQGIVIQSVPKKTLDKLTDNGHHQGIVIRCKAAPIQTSASLEELLAELTEPPLLLILDEVQDPHNLGACLRTADAAGVHAVIVPTHRACSLTATVRKVASGANVPLIQTNNLATTLRWLQEQGVWIIGTAEDGEQELFATSLTGSLAIVLGAEGNGLRRLTRERCDKLVRIPMFGTVASLNVSVATGICLYEAVRQRHAFVVC